MITRQIEVPAAAENLSVLQAFLEDFWQAARLPPEAQFAFSLGLEEVFVNVVTHGIAQSGASEVFVTLTADDASIELTLRDDTRAFNPLDLPAPDLEAALEERALGGLGVHLVRTLMDEVSYRRVGDQNQLTLRKALVRAPD